jgi:precorrin isomerase
MTGVTRLGFDAARPNQIIAVIGKAPVPLLELADMRTAKQAAVPSRRESIQPSRGSQTSPP